MPSGRVAAGLTTAVLAAVGPMAAELRAGLTPVVLAIFPSMFGLFQPHTDVASYLAHLSKLWIGLAASALLFRTIHLFFLRDVKTGLVWFTKILTDPFHDIMLYWKSPLYLLRGELIEPPKQHA